MGKKNLKITHSQRIVANRIGMTRTLFVNGDKLFAGFLYEKQSDIYLRLSCCNKNDLSVLWEKDFSKLFYECHPTSDNKMIWGSYHNKVMCLENDNGETVWEYESDLQNQYGIQFGLSSNIEDNHLVIVGQRRETTFSDTTYDLYCISSVDGSLAWLSKIDGHVRFIQIENGRLYVKTLNSLCCFDMEDGKEIWHTEIKGSSAVFLDDMIVCAKSSAIYFYSKENGKCLQEYIVTPELEGKVQIKTERYSTSISKSDFSRIEIISAYDDNRIYACTVSGNVYALDVKKSKGLLGKSKIEVNEIWKFDAEHLNYLGSLSSPECPVIFSKQISEDLFVVGEETFKVSLLNPATGELISNIKPKLKNVLKEVFLDGDAVYLLCDKGWIYKGEFVEL